MIEVPRVACNDLGDLGMAVAEDRAHLPGGEVENGAPVGVVNIDARGTLDDQGHETAAIANEMVAGPPPEIFIRIR